MSFLPCWVGFVLLSRIEGRSFSKNSSKSLFSPVSSDTYGWSTFSGVGPGGDGGFDNGLPRTDFGGLVISPFLLSDCDGGLIGVDMDEERRCNLEEGIVVESFLGNCSLKFGEGFKDVCGFLWFDPGGRDIGTDKEEDRRCNFGEGVDVRSSLSFVTDVPLTLSN